MYCLDGEHVLTYSTYRNARCKQKGTSTAPPKFSSAPCGFCSRAVTPWCIRRRQALWPIRIERVRVTKNPGSIDLGTFPYSGGNPLLENNHLLGSNRQTYRFVLCGLGADTTDISIATCDMSITVLLQMEEKGAPTRTRAFHVLCKRFVNSLEQSALVLVLVPLSVSQHAFHRPRFTPASRTTS